VAVDHVAIGDLKAPAIAGYLARIMGLIFLGYLSSFVLHRDENNPLKLFQLGLATPAMLTGLINAGNVSRQTSMNIISQPAAVGFVLPVYAGSGPEPKLRTFSLPKENSADQFFRGLTGAKFDKVWFVITSKRDTLAEAEKEVQRINRSGRALHAEVYAP